MTTWNDLFRPGDANDFFQAIRLQPFDAESRAYDTNNARWLMELSRLVYREEGRAELLRRAELEEVLPIDSASSDTQGYIVSPRSRTWAALVFRGTSNLADFLTDSRAGMQPWSKGGRVHRGFERGIDSVWNADLVRKLDDLHCPVFYAGHSLGAALATLAASLRPCDAVYTFGSPLVGDSAFTETITDTPIFRVVDHHDVVARVPPHVPLLLPYTHVGDEHALAHLPGETTTSGIEDVAATLTLVLAGRWDELQRENPLGPPDPLADHAPINYLRRIV